VNAEISGEAVAGPWGTVIATGHFGKADKRGCHRCAF